MYLIFGGVTTVVSWLVYSLCMLALPFDTEVHYSLFGMALDFNIKILVANVLSWIIAASVAFVTNKLWVFSSKSWEAKIVRREAMTFFTARGITGFLEIFSVPLLVSWGLSQTLFGIEGLPAKIIVSVVIVILNYIFSKFISFKTQQ